MKALVLKELRELSGHRRCCAGGICDPAGKIAGHESLRLAARRE